MGSRKGVERVTNEGKSIEEMYAEKVLQHRNELLKRLKMTGKNETICFSDWQVKILVDWIEELRKEAWE